MSDRGHKITKIPKKGGGNKRRVYVNGKCVPVNKIIPDFQQHSATSSANFATNESLNDLQLIDDDASCMFSDHSDGNSMLLVTHESFYI